MKKRILASTMASVMALSAVSTTLAASAAYISDGFDEAVTKAELKKYIEAPEMVKLVDEGGLEKFGTLSVERFTKAYSLAQNVVDDSEAEDYEVVAAFQILKAAEKGLVQYTKAELQGLIAQNKKKYDDQNVLNAAAGLTKYDDTQYSTFVSAYEDAEDAVESDDLRDITDAYEVLEAAQSMTIKPTVTKRQFEAAKKAYEQALATENTHQPWERGTVKCSGNSTFNGKTFAWGIVYNYAASGEDGLNDAYKKFTDIDGLTETNDTDTVNALTYMKQATELLTSFTLVNKLDSGGEAKVKNELKKYHGQMVKEFVPAATVSAIVTNFINTSKTSATDCASIYIGGKVYAVVDMAAVNAISGNDLGNVWDYTLSAQTTYNPLSVSAMKMSKVISAEIKVRAGKDVYAVVTKNKIFTTGEGKLVPIDGSTTYFSTSSPDLAAVGTANGYTADELEVKPIRKGTTVTLSNFIDATFGQVSGTDAATTAGTELPGMQSAMATALGSVQTSLVDPALAAYTTAATVADNMQAKGTADTALWVVPADPESESLIAPQVDEPEETSVLAQIKTLVSDTLDKIEDYTSLTDCTQPKGTKAFAEEQEKIYAPAATTDASATGKLAEIETAINAATEAYTAAIAVIDGAQPLGTSANNVTATDFNATKTAITNALTELNAKLGDVSNAIETAKTDVTVSNVSAVVEAMEQAYAKTDISAELTAFYAEAENSEGTQLDATVAADVLDFASKAVDATDTTATGKLDTTDLEAIDVKSPTDCNAAIKNLEDRIDLIKEALGAIETAISAVGTTITPAKITNVQTKVNDMAIYIKGGEAPRAVLAALTELVDAVVANVEYDADHDNSGDATITELADVTAIISASNVNATTPIDSLITNAMIAGIPETGLTVDASFDGKKTALTDALTAVNNALTALTSAITNATTGTVTSAKVASVNTAAAAVKTALEANLTELASTLAEVAESDDGSDLATDAMAPVTAFDTAAKLVNDATSGISSYITSTALSALTAAENASGGLTSITTATEMSVFNATAYDGAVATNFNKYNAYAFNNVVDSYQETAFGKKISDDFSWGTNTETYVTVADLTLGMWMAYNYYGIDLSGKNAGLVKSNKTPDYAVTSRIDYTNAVTDPTKSSPAAQKLIYNYLKYALEDRYKADASEGTSWTQIQPLLDKVYDLQAETVDCSLFSASHMKLVYERSCASAWLKNKRNTLNYVDKETAIDDGEGNPQTSTQMYKRLNDAYKQLKAEKDNFEYSYETIVKNIAKMAEEVDKGVGGDGLKDALYKTATAFLKVEALKKTATNVWDDSEAITDSGEFRLNNRLYTQDGKSSLGYSYNTSTHAVSTDDVAAAKGGVNKTHYDLHQAYKTLLDVYEKATTEPETKYDTDVDGDGRFGLNDAVIAVELLSENKFSDAKWDFNEDGVVDLQDVVKLVELLSEMG